MRVHCDCPTDTHAAPGATPAVHDRKATPFLVLSVFRFVAARIVTLLLEVLSGPVIERATGDGCAPSGVIGRMPSWTVASSTDSRAARAISGGSEGQRRLWLAVAVATVVLGGWPGTPAADQVDCGFEPQSNERVECFRILVPRDHGVPDGTSFVLPVAVIRGDADDRPPVVLVDGGPGGPTLDPVWPGWLTAPWFELTAALRKERDFVVFDARGVGRSRPSLDCQEVDKDAADRTEPPGSEVPFYLRQREALRACWKRLVASGIDFSSVSTTAMADDIATIADELGHDEVDLWSFSFGTRVSLELIRRHPGLVRAAVLDSAVPTHGSLDNDLPWMTWRAFEQLFDDCEQDPECAAAYPDLRNEFLDQIRSLNEEPQTLAIVYGDGRWGEGSVVYMNGNDLVFYAYGAFYLTEALPYLPAVIHASARVPDYHLTWVLLVPVAC